MEFFIALVVLSILLGGLGRAVVFLVKLAFWAILFYIVVNLVIGLFAWTIASWIVGGVILGIFAILGFFS